MWKEILTITFRKKEYFWKIKELREIYNCTSNIRLLEHIIDLEIKRQKL